MGQSMIHPVSVVVRVSEVGLTDAGVAVTSAVCQHLLRRTGSLMAASTALPARCTIKQLDAGERAMSFWNNPAEDAAGEQYRDKKNGKRRDRSCCPLGGAQVALPAPGRPPTAAPPGTGRRPAE
jgi:uncharacterized cupredoxin-like copper-binding protein